MLPPPRRSNPPRRRLSDLGSGISDHDVDVDYDDDGDENGGVGGGDEDDYDDGGDGEGGVYGGDEDDAAAARQQLSDEKYQIAAIAEGTILAESDVTRCCLLSLRF